MTIKNEIKNKWDHGKKVEGDREADGKANAEGKMEADDMSIAENKMDADGTKLSLQVFGVLYTPCTASKKWKFPSELGISYINPLDSYWYAYVFKKWVSRSWV